MIGMKLIRRFEQKKKKKVIEMKLVETEKGTE